MGKASIIVYVTAAILLLLFLSYSPKKYSSHRHRRLKLRSNFTFTTPHNASQHHEPVAFDPLVAEIERRREEKQWERQYFEHSHSEFAAHDSAPGEESQPEWEDFMDAEDYLNDDDKFNVTNRLILLFPKIDVEPVDGFVSEHELTEWNLQQAEREVLLRTQREVEIHDKNHDGFISFSEYEPPSWVHNAGSVANSDFHLFIWHKPSASLVPLSNMLSLMFSVLITLLTLMFIAFLYNVAIAEAVVVLVL